MELNGIKKVLQLDSCGGFFIILWEISRSTKAGRRPYKRGTGASFQPFIRRPGVQLQEMYNNASGKKQIFHILLV